MFIPILAFDNSQYLGKKATKPVARMIATPASKAPVKAVAKKVIKKAPTKKVVKKVKTLIKKK